MLTYRWSQPPYLRPAMSRLEVNYKTFVQETCDTQNHIYIYIMISLSYPSKGSNSMKNGVFMKCIWTKHVHMRRVMNLKFRDWTSQLQKRVRDQQKQMLERSDVWSWDFTSFVSNIGPRINYSTFSVLTQILAQHNENRKWNMSAARN